MKSLANLMITSSVARYRGDDESDNLFCMIYVKFTRCSKGSFSKAFVDRSQCFGLQTFFWVLRSGLIYYWPFRYLTQNLVTRLSFGSGSAQAAPPLLPLLTLLFRGLASVSLHPYLRSTSSSPSKIIYFNSFKLTGTPSPTRKWIHSVTQGIIYPL